jgi:hypothetical protein
LINEDSKAGPEPGLSRWSGAEKMRQFLLVGLVLLAGCESLMGPRKRVMAPEKVDPPCMPIPEQQYRARDRLAYPDTYPYVSGGAGVGPRTWAEVPAEQYGRLSH